MTFEKPTGWFNKFRNAFRGVYLGVRDQNSFAVHLPMAALVFGLAIILELPLSKVLLLTLCVTMVLTAELFNTAVEFLAKAISNEFDENIRSALDIASGAVLVASMASAIIGTIVLLPPLLTFLEIAG